MANPENTSGTGKNPNASNYSSTGGSSNTTENIYSTIRYNRNNHTFNVQGQSIPATDFLNQIGVNAEDLRELSNRR